MRVSRGVLVTWFRSDVLVPWVRVDARDGVNAVVRVVVARGQVDAWGEIGREIEVIRKFNPIP